MSGGDCWHMETPYLVSFDVFQQLVLWLNSSTNSHRKGRQYLEKMPTLLHAGIEKELERLHLAHQHDQADIKQSLHQHLLLLRHALQRGGSIRAIREAYIHVFGGFTLDCPPWVEEILRHRYFLQRLKRPERTNRAYSKLLQQAIARMVPDNRIAPEVVAEWENELGSILTQSSHYTTQQERLQAFQMAIRCHEAALRVFTLQSYPLQYAKTCMHLGLAYQRSITTGSGTSLEHAIVYYETAARIFAYYDCQEQWALAQTALGSTHAQRPYGQGEEHLIQALSCHLAVLEATSPDASPTTWATIQVNLGDTHIRLSKQGARHHRLQALNCYKAALQVYTAHTHPKEWADLHVRLAAVFQDMAEEQPAKRDTYIGCAIVCCEAALTRHSISAVPVEYAATLATLGHLHCISSGENRLTNLELAEHYYRNALQIFTGQAFPEESHYIYAKLHEAESQRQALLSPREAFAGIPARV